LVRRRDLEVTLVTRDNCFLFTPVLAEGAGGELELSTEPSRQAYAQVERNSGLSRLRRSYCLPYLGHARRRRSGMEGRLDQADGQRPAVGRTPAADRRERPGGGRQPADLAGQEVNPCHTRT